MLITTVTDSKVAHDMTVIGGYNLIPTCPLPLPNVTKQKTNFFNLIPHSRTRSVDVNACPETKQKTSRTCNEKNIY